MVHKGGVQKDVCEAIYSRKLKDLRVERHLTPEQLAAETGLSKSALGKYETDDYKDISPFAIATLADFYGVSIDYLMERTETKNRPNTALHELHLSDDMIDVLKSGELNNRLLCEMVTHGNFRCFLVDAEIYIDCIVDMQINDMNVMLNMVRLQAIGQQGAENSDFYMRHWSWRRCSRKSTLLRSFPAISLPF